MTARPPSRDVEVDERAMQARLAGLDGRRPPAAACAAAACRSSVRHGRPIRSRVRDSRLAIVAVRNDRFAASRTSYGTPSRLPSASGEEAISATLLGGARSTPTSRRRRSRRRCVRDQVGERCCGRRTARGRSWGSAAPRGSVVGVERRSTTAVCSGEVQAGATTRERRGVLGHAERLGDRIQVAEVERIAVTSTSTSGIPFAQPARNVSQCDARYRLESYPSATPERG